MTEHLTDTTIAFLVANEGVEQVELTEPWEAVERAGGRPVLVAPKREPVRAMKHLDWADTFDPDMTTAEAREEDFDGFVLPGGVANPDQLRSDGNAVELLKETVTTDTPIAVICHGPWTLVEAGIVRGRTITSWPSLRTDLENAGAIWVDSEVVVDGNLVSSRKPDDLPAFCRAIVEAFARHD